MSDDDACGSRDCVLHAARPTGACTNGGCAHLKGSPAELRRTLLHLAALRRVALRSASRAYDDAAEYVERLERAHRMIDERRRDAEDRGERLEEVEWLDRLDTLLAGAETARYGERRWTDTARREAIEEAIALVVAAHPTARAHDLVPRLRALLDVESEGEVPRG